MRIAIALAVAALPLPGCDSGSEPAPDTAAVDTAPMEPSPPGLGSETEATAEPTSIPAALQGRWGLTEADCEPGRADAKGLLAISGNKLEFYESVGTLDEIEEATDNRIRASFDFTGEGMAWERDMALEIEDGGQALIRREYGEGAAPDPFRYTKCP